MKTYDLIIIGGGPAGISAALSAYKNQVKNILIIERNSQLGGILNQCIHDGFGAHKFQKELSGPEYSQRITEELKQTNVEVLLNTTALKIEPDNTVQIINSELGKTNIKTKSIILAMGCRERTRGAIRIHGNRPAGVYTAGIAQRFINIDGYLPGKNAIILGSGDIGLIAARRMTLKGARVLAVLEILPYHNGLPKNIEHCLNELDIPLMLSHTITKIHGKDRVEGVTITKVDENLLPIPATEKFIPCDTVLLSVGLIPENELSRNAGIHLDKKTMGPIVGELRQTNREGFFSCGNVLHVHDLVDYVSAEGELAGFGAAQYIHKNLKEGFTHAITTDNTISYVVPQKINIENITSSVELFIRTTKAFTNSSLYAYIDNKLIAHKNAQKFLPAELTSIRIDKNSLINATGKEIILKIEPAK